MGGGGGASQHSSRGVAVGVLVVKLAFYRLLDASEHHLVPVIITRSIDVAGARSPGLYSQNVMGSAGLKGVPSLYCQV